jgi:hypothetical protein
MPVKPSRVPILLTVSNENYLVIRVFVVFVAIWPAVAVIVFILVIFGFVFVLLVVIISRISRPETENIMLVVRIILCCSVR